MGVSWEEALKAYTCYRSTLRFVHDTEDEVCKALRNISKKIDDIYITCGANILDICNSKWRLNGFAWMEEALTGVNPIRSHLSPFNMDKHFTLSKWVDDLKHYLRTYEFSEIIEHPDIHKVLKAKARICNDMWTYQTPRHNLLHKIYMPNDAPNIAHGRMMERHILRDYPQRSLVFKALHVMWVIRNEGDQYIKECIPNFNPSQLITEWRDVMRTRDEDSLEAIVESQRYVGEQFNALLMLYSDFLGNYGSGNNIAQQYLDKTSYKAISLLKDYLKSIYKGVSDEQEKTGARAYGKHTRPDGPESQLSAF
jgi:hypothetical protein